MKTSLNFFQSRNCEFGDLMLSYYIPSFQTANIWLLDSQSFEQHNLFLFLKNA